MATRTELLRVLLVEDDEEDYLITRDLLAAQARARFGLDWCADYDRALATIREQRHDVYLIDYRLGGRTGLELVREGFACRPRAPVLILTGQSDYEIDLEATALGVTDYLVKQELDAPSLERSIRYAVSQHRMIGELIQSEERFALAVRAANDGIWDWDLLANQIYLSPRWQAILGRPEEAQRDEPAAWFDLVHAEDVARLRTAIDAHLAGQTPHLQSEHRMRHADGSWRWVRSRGLAIRGPDGAATRMAGSLSDITDRRAAERQLQHDALHDGLTGLPNRALFMDRVDQILQRADRDPAVGCAVLFLDIDRFKLVNDRLSHAVGDRLLAELAARLQTVVRPRDTVARIGGDEFTLLLEDVASDESALKLTHRVQGSLRSPFRIDQHELFVTASIGIALSSDSIGASELLRNADIAMYDAKRRGRARSAVFDESMRHYAVSRASRENDLRLAVEQSSLDVHYQPIIDLATGRIVALEALARWPAAWPPVAPVDFIPIAEEIGLIGRLGQHVLSTALQSLARWRSRGLLSDDVCVSVNVSGRQLEDPLLPAHIRAALATAALPGSALRLEITESTLMQDPERTQAAMKDVSASGVAWHLDDFGTGYSSLAALHHLPVDALKIDRSFIASMNGNGGGTNAIVHSIIALAHSLGLRVIAEGIEEPAQLATVQALGCEYAQGYFFSVPLDVEDAEALLSHWSPEDAIAAHDQQLPSRS